MSEAMQSFVKTFLAARTVSTRLVTVRTPDAERYTVQSIADKVSKSAAYVTQRLRLTELIEPIAQAFSR